VAEIGRKGGSQPIQDFLIKAITPGMPPFLDQQSFIVRQLGPEVVHYPPPYQQVIPPHDIAQEIDPVCHRLKPLSLLVEFQAQFFPEILLYLMTPPEQFLPIPRKKHKIVAVPQVVPAFQVMFDELVQTVQIDIGKKLAVQVANGKTLVSGSMEQGLMRRDVFQKPCIAPEDIMIRAVVKDKRPREPQGSFIPYPAGNQGEKDLLVDAHKVVLNIKLDVEGRMIPVQANLPDKLLKPQNAAMHPFSFPTGIGVMDEYRLPYPLQVIH
jgi:hypothetical protein